MYVCKYYLSDNFSYILLNFYMCFLNLKESVTGLEGLVLSSAFKLNQPSNMRDWHGRKIFLSFLLSWAKKTS